MIEESEYITPGNVMFTIIDLNPIKIQGYLSEFDVNKVNLGTKAVIENTNGIKKNGVISFISPSAETSTRTFEITIEADNAVNAPDISVFMALVFNCVWIADVTPFT